MFNRCNSIWNLMYLLTWAALSKLAAGKNWKMCIKISSGKYIQSPNTPWFCPTIWFGMMTTNEKTFTSMLLVYQLYAIECFHFILQNRTNINNSFNLVIHLIHEHCIDNFTFYYKFNRSTLIPNKRVVCFATRLWLVKIVTSRNQPVDEKWLTRLWLTKRVLTIQCPWSNQNKQHWNF